MMKKVLCILLVICMAFVSSLPITTHTVQAATQATYYISPTGNDNNAGTLAAPFLTIEKARDTIRTINQNMTGDIYVYLRGGTYSLASTLVFDYRDSGTNGYNVIYKAYTGEVPIISGGKAITGWTLFDATKNIYKSATIAGGIETRQLYINGVRAIRAKSSAGIPGAVRTSTGYTTTDSAMQNWGNKADIEFVYNFAHIQMRRGVASISGTTITMDQPCWSMVYFDSQYPNYMENAYELLDSEGEWYLDRNTDAFYYKPRSGENLSTASVIAPTLETLVSGAGTLDQPVHNMKFEGLTFSYATWLRPNSTEGFVDIQAQFCFKPNATQPFNYDMDNWVRTPANITFSAAKNIIFERNKFNKLGAVGLELMTGSQSNTISGNEFTDISSSGIQIGGTTINDHQPIDARYIVKDNSITNNYIHNIGAEYKGAVGVFAGYTDNTLIAHNELSDLPYSAISVGWGWGGADWYDIPLVPLRDYQQAYLGNSDTSACKDNKIISNHIHDTMKFSIDGGSIYTLGSQHGTIITGNVIHDQRNDYGAIYLDNLSRYITVRYNLLYNNVMNWITKDFDHDIEFNYSDKDRSDYWTQQESLVANNFYIANSNVPQYILDNAGLEAAYKDLLTGPAINLAIGRTATGYYNDGTLANMWSGNEAYKATDGDPTTRAQATGQYAWTEQVDLWSTYSISRVKVIFGSGTYATQYDIQTSTNGVDFTTVKNVTGCTGGESDQTFSATNARYIRIKAIKPDGPNQTGGQMGIAELEIYGNPTFTPTVLPDQSVVVKPDINIANNKKTKAYYINGTTASMVSGHEAKYAVDANTSTYAQASGQYRWIEEVDLERAYSINKIVTTFANGLYATEYEIQASLTGAAGSFTTIKSVTGCTGGRNEQKLNAPVNARFIRIQANKPDAVGQTGVQMAIAELEIYQDKNAFFKKTATGYYNDGSLATMWTGYEADKANDGDINTYAQATGQYAWTEQIDMGAVYNLDGITIYFAGDTYATEYDIQVSTNGTSFTTVKSVTGCTGGVDTQTFTPVDARYVRIKAIKPDGPDQEGIQMGIAEVVITVNDNVLKMSQMTDGAASGNKYIYQRISSQQITFQTGDIIAYDVKLFTNDAAIGGIEIYNTDNSGFGGTGWTDQNAVGGTPGADLTGRALNKWYHRELTVPASMVGKTSNKWMLSFENDSAGKLLQAAYDNIVIIRGGSIVGTIYKNGNPSENVLQLINSYYSPVNVFMVNR